MANSRQTFSEALSSLLALEIDLIPLQPGGKRPLEKAWGTPVTRRLATVLKRFGSQHKNEPLDDVVREHCNIGVLNEPSRVVTLDCDSPLAGTALKAAAEALGGSVGDLDVDTAWVSVNGQKALFRRPLTLKPERVVFKTWDVAGGSFNVIFELRGTGQDVLPGSFRVDADRHLRWLHETPKKIPPMPKWLVALFAELKVGHGPGIDAMLAALGVDRSALRRVPYGFSAYPSYLRCPEREFVNARYEVPALLEQFGYVRDGERWKPAESKASAGIVPPRDGKDENWLCEHEGDVLAGIFDAWRVIVEHVYKGDSERAAAETRVEQQRLVGVAVADPVDPVVKSGRVKKQAANKRARPGKDRAEEQEPDGESPAAEEPEPEHATGEEDRNQKRRSGRFHRGFLYESIKQVTPVITGLMVLTPGLHMLVAQPKGGKSVLSTGLFLTAVSGIPIGGFSAFEPVPSLYIALDEDMRQNLNPRLVGIMAHKDVPEQALIDRAHIIDNSDILLTFCADNAINVMDPLPIEWTPDDEDSDDQAKAKAALVRPRFNPYFRALYWYLFKNRIRFCAIDLLTSIRTSTETNNVYVKDLEEISAINKIGLATGCAIVGLHHMNKLAGASASDKNDHLTLVSGTAAIAGAAQSIITMRRVVTDDPTAVYNVHPRGEKIVVNQSSRDTAGLKDTAMSLVVAELLPEKVVKLPDGNLVQKALYWEVVGPSEILTHAEFKTFVLEFLYDAGPNAVVGFDGIMTAAVNANIANMRNKESYRKAVSQLASRGSISSVRGPGGGYGLSADQRETVRQIRATRGF